MGKKTVLIFDDSIDGHHVEYLSHLWTHTAIKSGQNYLFIVPEGFKAYIRDSDMDSVSHRQVLYLTSEESTRLMASRGLKKSWITAKILSHYITQYNVTEVFAINLMALLPFFIIVNPRVQVSGIIYMIYLYRWKNSGILARSQDALKYYSFALMNNFRNIFILNDAPAAKLLNKLYRADKFRYLPDPVNTSKCSKYKDMRIELNAEGKTILVHFGALTDRKGTLELLNSIPLLSENIRSNFCFVFAGKIYSDIREQFYDKLNSFKNRENIIVRDEFCSYDYINSLCYTADMIMIPYKSTGASSGVINYAAYFGKPVLGPYEGLLGKLIRKNKLGYCLKEISGQSIASFLSEFPTIQYSKNTEFLMQNSIDTFAKAILD